MGLLNDLIKQNKTEKSHEDILELRRLIGEYINKDDSPERVKIRQEFLDGKPLSGETGIRRKLGAIDLEFFGRAYFPHYFFRPSPTFHRELDQIWHNGVLKASFPTSREESQIISRMKGSKSALAAPRGHAKSTNVTFKDTIHAVVYEYKHYILLLSDSSDQAEGFLSNIREEFEENEAIREDFGDLAGKIWRNNVLLTVTNIKIEAIGSGKKVRGRKHKNWRPDLIILDDIENDENVRTPEQRKKLENWFYKAVSKAGDDYTDIVYIGTVLHYDALLMKILRNPGYMTIKYQAVISFAVNKGLWDQWERIYTDLANQQRAADAQAFFEAHKEDMLEGTKVLWEEKLSYYDLMVSKVDEGEASFYSEFQNEPINPDDCLFNEEWFDFYNAYTIDFKVGFTFFGFVDPSLGKTKKSDYSTIITLAREDSTGYLYDLDADIERRHPDKIIEDVLEKERWLRITYGKGYKKFGCETNQFQFFLKEQLAKASAKAGLYLPIEEVNQTTNKELRIESLQPDIKNKYIKFNPAHKTLLEQLKFFPMAANDDGPDALEACRTLAGGNKRKLRTLSKRLLGL
ncbi:phage terminase large subunit [Dehalobacter sp. TeCB1]|uniref:phage terminase large subunit n=1 Tax=Dehalobacter sp. TeCB1 TaxID=1843715 RepID=UPI0032B84871